MVKSTKPIKSRRKFSTWFLNNQRKPRPLLVLILVVLFASVGARLLFHSFAAGDSLSLVPASSTQNVGSNFTVVVHENSGTDAINAVEADLTYDQTKLQFVSLDTSTSAFDLSATGSGGAGSIKIARAKSGTNLTGDQIVASITFKALATGTTPVTFDATSAIVTGAATPVNVLAVTVPGSYTIADTSAPTVPGGLTAGAKTVTSLAFSWTAATDNVGVTAYKIFRNGVLINSNVTTTTFTNTSLTPNTSYSYTVAAVDAAGNTSAQSTALAMSTLPDTTAPTVPGTPVAGTRTVTSIAISWTGSTDDVLVTGYNVFRATTLAGTYTKINPSLISGVTYTDTSLTPNTAYFYKVTANDAAGNASAQSAALSTSTLADTTAPGVPTGLTSPNQTTNSVDLTWIAPTDDVGVTGYKIYRSATIAGTYTQLNTSTTPSYTDSGLTQNTAYFYKVAANDAAGNTSAQSAAYSINTKAKPGDINSDGSVDIFDLSILASHFGQSGQTLSTGDLTGDGTVNIFDLSVLATNWGT